MSINVGNPDLPVCIDLTLEEDEESSPSPANGIAVVVCTEQDKDAGFSDTTQSAKDVSGEQYSTDLIDLTYSDDDSDDDSSIECYEESSSTSLCNKRHRTNPMLQRRANEPFARASHENSKSTNKVSQRRIHRRTRHEVKAAFPHPDTTLHGLKCSSKSDYEVVVKATKELDDRLVFFGAPPSLNLRRKIDQISGIPRALRRDMVQLNSWRNKIIHETGVEQLSDTGTTREVFLNIFSRILYAFIDYLPFWEFRKQSKHSNQTLQRKQPPYHHRL